jgi:hypothetical protein
MPPKPKRIGLLPADDPFNEQVRRCFSEADFVDIQLWSNRDWSMVTFKMRRGTHAALGNDQEAHAALRRILQAGGVDIAAHDLCVSMDGDALDGAFVPPQAPPPV